MRCEYDDGLKVDYSGSLRINKGEEVNVYMKEGLIPASIKSGLDAAASHSSCSELRQVARTVTETVGSKACIHE
jgi:hypothetical protein